MDVESGPIQAVDRLRARRGRLHVGDPPVHGVRQGIPVLRDRYERT